jgi:hypothetical protein
VGRRSRKRAQASPEQRHERSDPAPQTAPRPVRRRRDEERPRAPWGSFPLTELCVLVGLVIAVAGPFVGGPRGRLILAVGVGLVLLAGLELSIREHLAGYRSHTTQLAGAVAVVTMVVLFVAHIQRAIMLAAAAVVFGLAFCALREVFRRRSGGFGFR